MGKDAKTRTRGLFDKTGNQDLSLFAGKSAKQDEADRVRRTKAEIERLRAAMKVAQIEHDGRVRVTEKRIRELDASLSTGAHKIGPALGLFGVDIDPRYM